MSLLLTNNSDKQSYLSPHSNALPPSRVLFSVQVSPGRNLPLQICCSLSAFCHFSGYSLCLYNLAVDR